MDARDITGGGNNATGATADDDRLVFQFRIVALFDGGIEGVAIQMGDRKRGQFRVAGKAWAAAGGAAVGGLRHIGATVSAEAIHCVLRAHGLEFSTASGFGEMWHVQAL